MMIAPSEASRCAATAPIPELAPVTMVILPSSSLKLGAPLDTRAPADELQADGRTLADRIKIAVASAMQRSLRYLRRNDPPAGRRNDAKGVPMPRWPVLLLCMLTGCADKPREDAVSALPDIAGHELVDLTHPFNEQTLYWPTSPQKFELRELAHGPTGQGYFYSSYAFSSPEHGGTHLDAPIHFAEGGQTADQVPLTRLMAPAVVIDVSVQAARNPDYQLTPADIRAFEQRHGPIAEGSIVLLRTDWSRRWPDAKAYLGDDTPGDASKLRFPSFGPDSARLLVEERKVGALGVDTASIDYGRSTDFMVHRIAMGANVPGFENLTGLSRLPPKGALVIALPMKVEGGSGGPLRAIAVLPGRQPAAGR
jgi:kynurenine formamidase